MNIVANAHNYYHYQDATLIQGLQAFGHAVYLPPDYTTHLGGNECSYAVRMPADFGPIDLFIQFNPGGSPMPGVKSVMVWGEDQLTGFGGVEFELKRGFDVVFVKDLLDCESSGIPINYGIDDRYYCATSNGYRNLIDREVDICFLGYEGHGRTPILEKLLADFSDKKIELGYRPFDQPDDYWSRWTQSYITVPSHDPRYYEMLANTKVGLSLRGYGCDCARHWEVMASGAVPVVQLTPARIVQPEPMAAWFSEYHQLADIIRSVLNNPVAWQEFVDAAWGWNNTHHSTTARAKYFLDIVSGA